jgi:hypothetical protein
MFYM